MIRTDTPDQTTASTARSRRNSATEKHAGGEKEVHSASLNEKPLLLSSGEGKREQEEVAAIGSGVDPTRLLSSPPVQGLPSSNGEAIPHAFTPSTKVPPPLIPATYTPTPPGTTSSAPGLLFLPSSSLTAPAGRDGIDLTPPMNPIPLITSPLCEYEMGPEDDLDEDGRRRKKKRQPTQTTSSRPSAVDSTSSAYIPPHLQPEMITQPNLYYPGGLQQVSLPPALPPMIRPDRGKKSAHSSSTSTRSMKATARGGSHLRSAGNGSTKDGDESSPQRQEGEEEEDVQAREGAANGSPLPPLFSYILENKRLGREGRSAKKTSTSTSAHRLAAAVRRRNGVPMRDGGLSTSRTTISLCSSEAPRTASSGISSIGRSTQGNDGTGSSVDPGTSSFLPQHSIWLASALDSITSRSVPRGQGEGESGGDDATAIVMEKEDPAPVTATVLGPEAQEEADRRSAKTHSGKQEASSREGIESSPYRSTTEPISKGKKRSYVSSPLLLTKDVPPSLQEEKGIGGTGSGVDLVNSKRDGSQKDEALRWSGLLIASPCDSARKERNDMKPNSSTTDEKNSEKSVAKPSRRELPLQPPLWLQPNTDGKDRPHYSCFSPPRNPVLLAKELQAHPISAYLKPEGLSFLYPHHYPLPPGTHPSARGPLGSGEGKNENGTRAGKPDESPSGAPSNRTNPSGGLKDVGASVYPPLAAPNLLLQPSTSGRISAASGEESGSVNLGQEEDIPNAAMNSLSRSKSASVGILRSRRYSSGRSSRLFIKQSGSEGLRESGRKRRASEGDGAERHLAPMMIQVPPSMPSNGEGPPKSPLSVLSRGNSFLSLKSSVLAHRPSLGGPPSEKRSTSNSLPIAAEGSHCFSAPAPMALLPSTLPAAVGGGVGNEFLLPFRYGMGSPSQNLLVGDYSNSFSLPPSTGANTTTTTTTNNTATHTGGGGGGWNPFGERSLDGASSSHYSPSSVTATSSHTVSDFASGGSGGAAAAAAGVGGGGGLANMGLGNATGGDVPAGFPRPRRRSVRVNTPPLLPTMSSLVTGLDLQSGEPTAFSMGPLPMWSEKESHEASGAPSSAMAKTNSGSWQGWKEHPSLVTRRGSGAAAEMQMEEEASHRGEDVHGSTSHPTPFEHTEQKGEERRNTSGRRSTASSVVVETAMHGETKEEGVAAAVEKEKKGPGNREKEGVLLPTSTPSSVLGDSSGSGRYLSSRIDPPERESSKFRWDPSQVNPPSPPTSAGARKVAAVEGSNGGADGEGWLSRKYSLSFHHSFPFKSLRSSLQSGTTTTTTTTTSGSRGGGGGGDGEEERTNFCPPSNLSPEVTPSSTNESPSFRLKTKRGRGNMDAKEGERSGNHPYSLGAGLPSLIPPPPPPPTGRPSFSNPSMLGMEVPFGELHRSGGTRTSCGSLSSTNGGGGGGGRSGGRVDRPSRMPATPPTSFPGASSSSYSSLMSAMAGGGGRQSMGSPHYEYLPLAPQVPQRYGTLRDPPPPAAVPPPPSRGGGGVGEEEDGYGLCTSPVGGWPFLMEDARSSRSQRSGSAVIPMAVSSASRGRSYPHRRHTLHSTFLPNDSTDHPSATEREGKQGNAFDKEGSLSPYHPPSRVSHPSSSFPSSALFVEPGGPESEQSSMGRSGGGGGYGWRSPMATASGEEGHVKRGGVLDPTHAKAEPRPHGVSPMPSPTSSSPVHPPPSSSTPPEVEPRKETDQRKRDEQRTEKSEASRGDYSHSSRSTTSSTQHSTTTMTSRLPSKPPEQVERKPPPPLLHGATSLFPSVEVPAPTTTTTKVPPPAVLVAVIAPLFPKRDSSFYASRKGSDALQPPRPSSGSTPPPPSSQEEDEEDEKKTLHHLHDPSDATKVIPSLPPLPVASQKRPSGVSVGTSATEAASSPLTKKVQQTSGDTPHATEVEGSGLVLLVPPSEATNVVDDDIPSEKEDDHKNHSSATIPSSSVHRYLPPSQEADSPLLRGSKPKDIPTRRSSMVSVGRSGSPLTEEKRPTSSTKQAVPSAPKPVEGGDGGPTPTTHPQQEEKATYESETTPSSISPDVERRSGIVEAVLNVLRRSGRPSSMDRLPGPSPRVPSSTSWRNRDGVRPTPSLPRGGGEGVHDASPSRDGSTGIGLDIMPLIASSLQWGAPSTATSSMAPPSVNLTRTMLGPLPSVLVAVTPMSTMDSPSPMIRTSTSTSGAAMRLGLTAPPLGIPLMRTSVGTSARARRRSSGSSPTTATTTTEVDGDEVGFSYFGVPFELPSAILPPAAAAVPPPPHPVVVVGTTPPTARSSLLALTAAAGSANASVGGGPPSIPTLPSSFTRSPSNCTASALASLVESIPFFSSRYGTVAEGEGVSPADASPSGPFVPTVPTTLPHSEQEIPPLPKDESTALEKGNPMEKHPSEKIDLTSLPHRSPQPSRTTTTTAEVYSNRSSVLSAARQGPPPPYGIGKGVDPISSTSWATAYEEERMERSSSVRGMSSEKRRSLLSCPPSTSTSSPPSLTPTPPIASVSGRGSVSPSSTVVPRSFSRAPRHRSTGEPEPSERREEEKENEKEEEGDDGERRRSSVARSLRFPSPSPPFPPSASPSPAPVSPIPAMDVAGGRPRHLRSEASTASEGSSQRTLSSHSKLPASMLTAMGSGGGHRGSGVSFHPPRDGIVKEHAPDAPKPLSSPSTMEEKKHPFSAERMASSHVPHPSSDGGTTTTTAAAVDGERGERESHTPLESLSLPPSSVLPPTSPFSYVLFRTDSTRHPPRSSSGRSSLLGDSEHAGTDPASRPFSGAPLLSSITSVPSGEGAASAVQPSQQYTKVYAYASAPESDRRGNLNVPRRRLPLLGYETPRQRMEGGGVLAGGERRLHGSFLSFLVSHSGMGSSVTNGAKEALPSLQNEDPHRHSPTDGSSLSRPSHHEMNTKEEPQPAPPSTKAQTSSEAKRVAAKDPQNDDDDMQETEERTSREPPVPTPTSSVRTGRAAAAPSASSSSSTVGGSTTATHTTKQGGGGKAQPHHTEEEIEMESLSPERSPHLTRPPSSRAESSPPLPFPSSALRWFGTSASPGEDLSSGVTPTPSDENISRINPMPLGRRKSIVEGESSAVGFSHVASLFRNSNSFTGFSGALGGLLRSPEATRGSGPSPERPSPSTAQPPILSLISSLDIAAGQGSDTTTREEGAPAPPPLALGLPSLRSGGFPFTPSSTSFQSGGVVGLGRRRSSLQGFIATNTKEGESGSGGGGEGGRVASPFSRRPRRWMPPPLSAIMEEGGGGRGGGSAAPAPPLTSSPSPAVLSTGQRRGGSMRPSLVSPRSGGVVVLDVEDTAEREGAGQGVGGGGGGRPAGSVGLPSPHTRVQSILQSGGNTTTSGGGEGGGAESNPNGATAFGHPSPSSLWGYAKDPFFGFAPLTIQHTASPSPAGDKRGSELLSQFGGEEDSFVGGGKEEDRRQGGFFATSLVSGFFSSSQRPFHPRASRSLRSGAAGGGSGGSMGGELSMVFGKNMFLFPPPTFTSTGDGEGAASEAPPPVGPTPDPLAPHLLSGTRNSLSMGGGGGGGIFVSTPSAGSGGGGGGGAGLGFGFGPGQGDSVFSSRDMNIGQFGFRANTPTPQKRRRSRLERMRQRALLRQNSMEYDDDEDEDDDDFDDYRGDDDDDDDYLAGTISRRPRFQKYPVLRLMRQRGGGSYSLVSRDVGACSTSLSGSQNPPSSQRKSIRVTPVVPAGMTVSLDSNSDLRQAMMVRIEEAKEVSMSTNAGSSVMQTSDSAISFQTAQPSSPGMMTTTMPVPPHDSLQANEEGLSLYGVRIGGKEEFPGHPTSTIQAGTFLLRANQEEGNASPSSPSLSCPSVEEASR